jgi:hypothetical protein
MSSRFAYALDCGEDRKAIGIYTKGRKKWQKRKKRRENRKVGTLDLAKSSRYEG